MLPILASDPGHAPTVEPHYLRTPSLPGIELVAAVHRGPLAPTLVDHRYCFARIDAGDADVRFGSTLVRLGRGVLITREPGDVVIAARRHSTETRYRGIFVEPSLAARYVAPAAGERPRGRLTRGLGGSASVRAFDALFDAASDGAPPLEQQCRLAAFLEAAVAGPEDPLPEQRQTPAIARTRRLIEARFAETLHLEELAAAAGLSRFYLLRRFGAEVGLPPHAYQLALRIDCARTLIAEGVALCDVAARCGFTDQSHLTRQFRRAVGVPPGAYARATRAGRPPG